MLKQGKKQLTLNSLELVDYHNFLLSTSDLMQLYSWGFFSLCINAKKKKTLETSFDLTPLFKTSVDARVEGLDLNVDYLENQCHNLIQKKYGRTRCLPCTHVSFSEL